MVKAVEMLIHGKCYVVCWKDIFFGFIEALASKGILRRNPIEDGAISGFSGQKTVPE